MKFARLPHYVRRVKELGPKKSFELLSNRMHASFFEQYKRYQADKKKAALTWPAIAYKYKLGNFTDYWKLVQKRSLDFAPHLYDTKYQDETTLFARADEFAHNCFDILGSRDQCLMVMPWHADFRLQHQKPDADYLFDKTLFYKDYVIKHGLTDRLIKDIKVPWELSRFQHLVVLGAAFEKIKNPLYSKAFVLQITDWIQENPYLLGPNWVCPMDVSIRALNWIWGFHYFKNVPEITETFWQQFTESLYNHFIYLENNWETGIHTSNHYLSDLIGYFGLTWFFGDLPGIKKKQVWCHKKILQEFEKQVFEEGTDYEGSTKYHQLVTEIFYQFYLLSQEMGFAVPGSFTKKLKKMFTFINWCSTTPGNMIMIGDDDSGKLIDGLPNDLIKIMKEPEQETEKYYPQFGLSVLKNKTWHATLRHHSFNGQQPSGHFHNDIASVTIAVNGIPIIVDPGSYIYTPSAIWRNALRSITTHNSFFIKDAEPAEFDPTSLFILPITPQTKVDSLFNAQHDLYGITAQRILTFYESDNKIVLTDTWSETQETLLAQWNFTLAPHIVPYRSNHEWHLFYNNQLLLKLESPDLQFETVSGWYAPQYGTKIACKRLVATHHVSDTPIVTTLRLA